MILYDVSVTGIQTGTPEFVKLLTERIANLPAELQMTQKPQKHEHKILQKPILW